MSSQTIQPDNPHAAELQYTDKRTFGRGSEATGRMRRVISREQGRALETIGHAVDYLNDSLLLEGPDYEIVTGPSATTDAVQILITLHLQMLQSLPLVEPLSTRLWNALLRRSKPTPRVVPLSTR